MKMKPADAIMANAASLAAVLGVSEREIAKAALTLAIGIAERKGDPDNFLGTLVALAQKEARK
jgi:hypothetical protein